MFYRMERRNRPAATLIKEYCDQKSGKVSDARRELQRRFRSIFFVGDISAEGVGKYDFILLARHPQPELCEVLKVARYLLYDGGRAIFPLPTEPDAPALWSALMDGIGFQQLFLVRAEPGAAPYLCAVKAIPGGEGGF